MKYFGKIFFWVVLFQACSHNPVSTPKRVPASSSELSCQNILLKTQTVTDSINGKEILIQKIQDSLGMSHIPLNKIFGGEPGASEVVLGFAGGAHVYLLVDGLRIDGGILNKVRAKKSSLVDNNSLLVRFTDMPTQSIEKMKEYLLTNDKISSLSCVSTACKVLKQGDVILAGNAKNPVQELANIFSEGFVDSTGKAIPYELYSLNAKFKLESGKDNFKEMYLTHVIGIPLAAVTMGGPVAFVIGYIIFQEIQKE